MRSWLFSMLVGDLKPPHPGICDRCAAEFHGDCLLAQYAFMRYATCECRRRGCRSGKKQVRKKFRTRKKFLLVLQPRENR